MQDFNNYTLNEAKNTHMTHIEDLVLDGGVKGAREAILALRSLRDMLAGHAKGKTDVTVKWDGAPAVFAGINPENGKFFVGSKSIFNANPKLNYTDADVDENHSGGLAVKLKVALKELSKLGIKGIIQGDIMFSKGDLKKAVIDGQKYITMHPNTIAYAVPADSKLAKTLLKAQIGVVWHTEYTGSSLQSMSASFGVDVSKLKKVSSIWSISADLPDMSGVATFNAKETKVLTSHLSNAGKVFKKIAAGTLKEIESNSELNLLINTFNNTKVRNGQRITNTTKHVAELINWVSARYQKEIDKRKSEKGKTSQAVKRDAILAFFSPQNKANLKLIFDLQNYIVEAKLMLIKKLAEVGGISTFVKTADGFKVTSPEGFVAIDHLTGSAVKLVDRMEFSKNNFDPSIIKGWESST
tara:strand:- start:231 stop:1466 length:1236 start_codon:yes stop_codon:yes gene_type:complete